MTKVKYSQIDDDLIKKLTTQAYEKRVEMEEKKGSFKKTEREYFEMIEEILAISEKVGVSDPVYVMPEESGVKTGLTLSFSKSSSVSVPDEKKLVNFIHSHNSLSSALTEKVDKTTLKKLIIVKELEAKGNNFNSINLLNSLKKLGVKIQEKRNVVLKDSLPKKIQG